MAAMRMNAQLKRMKERRRMKSTGEICQLVDLNPPKAANSNCKKETERERHLSSAAA